MLHRYAWKDVPRFCAVILICSGLAAWGQDATSGQIVGNLSDPSGAMVPNAQVTVKNIDTGQTMTVPANSLGHYVAPLLPPGNYSVSVAAVGFAPVAKSPSSSRPVPPLQ